MIENERDKNKKTNKTRDNYTDFWYSQLLTQQHQDNQWKANKPCKRDNLSEKEQWSKKFIIFSELLIGI